MNCVCIYTQNLLIKQRPWSTLGKKKINKPTQQNQNTTTKQCHLACSEAVQSYNSLAYSPTFCLISTQKTSPVQIPRLSDCRLASTSVHSNESVPRRLMDASSPGWGQQRRGETESPGLSRSDVSIHLGCGRNSQLVSWVAWFEGFINHNDSRSEIFPWNTFLGENANLSLLKRSEGMYINFKENWPTDFPWKSQLPISLPALQPTFTHDRLLHGSPIPEPSGLGLKDCLHSSLKHPVPPVLLERGPIRLTEPYKHLENKGKTARQTLGENQVRWKCGVPVPTDLLVGK